MRSILALSSAGVGSGERLNYAHFCSFPLKVSFATPCVSLFIFKLKAPMFSNMKNEMNHISMYFVVSCDVSSEGTLVSCLVSSSWRTSN